MKITEKQVQSAVITYLKYRPDVYFIRNNSIAGKIIRPNGTIGWVNNAKIGAPDIVLVKDGKFIGLELKSSNGRQSKEQKQAEKDIKHCGGIYKIVRYIDDIVELLGAK